MSSVVNDGTSNERRGLKVHVQGVGLLGPALISWAASLDVLRGSSPHVSRPTVLPPPMRLPAAERRRAGSAVKLAMAVADQAVAQAQADPSTLATVFTSSSGEGVNCHSLCETLATPAPMVSPTRFTNSVHNAASGCWHIAVASRASSTSLCAFDGSFGAGLIEAATSVQLSGTPMLLVASDSPYPEPLNSARPMPDDFGMALMLVPYTSDAGSDLTLATLSITLVDATHAATGCEDASLEALRSAIPAAAALPLLVALAKGTSPQQVVLEYLPTTRIQIDIE
jgi:Beta-ketoacyl synthase, N-terminal domain